MMPVGQPSIRLKQGIFTNSEATAAKLSNHPRWMYVRMTYAFQIEIGRGLVEVGL